MEKIKIEKGTVQETLLIPLYGRKYAMDLYPDLFMDHDCQALFDRIDFTVPDNMKGMLGNIGCIMGATRQYDMASAIQLMHNMMVVHAKAVIAYKEAGYEGR